MGSDAEKLPGAYKLKMILFLGAAAVIGWSLAALVYTGSGTPVLRRIRVFNPSGDVIKDLQVKVRVGTTYHSIATFSMVDPEHVVANDADYNGFSVMSGGGTAFVPNVDEVVVSITMIDSSTSADVTLPDIPILAPSGTLDEITVIVDDNPAASKWLVLATGFYQTDDSFALLSVDPLPQATAPKP